MLEKSKLLNCMLNKGLRKLKVRYVKVRLYKLSQLKVRKEKKISNYNNKLSISVTVRPEIKK